MDAAPQKGQAPEGKIGTLQKQTQQNIATILSDCVVDKDDCKYSTL